jgi:hypothetical protein
MKDLESSRMVGLLHLADGEAIQHLQPHNTPITPTTKRGESTGIDGPYFSIKSWSKEMASPTFSPPCRTQETRSTMPHATN